ncbi:MAG: hypothetical protein FJ260_01925 [Planctomycetes bacterium]|nr:hypothetical protein [Planctomycetota bacterium]
MRHPRVIQVRRTIVLAAGISACAIGAVARPARAQGCFGPPVPTVSPADAVALARACGGGDGGIAVALALQSDRFAEWSARWEGGAEPGGAEALWLRVLGARRDGSGKVMAADAPRLRASGQAARDDLAVQRRADRALLDAIVANACPGGNVAAVRARAAAIIRRPMIFETRGVLVTDPLQFLECDPAVVARLVSLGGGEALAAAGKSVEEAFAARQLVAVNRMLEAALDNSDPWNDPKLDAASDGVWSAFGRASQAIGAVDPAAGAWLRLRAANDRASKAPPRTPTEDEIAARIGQVPLEDGDGELERYAARRKALLDDLLTQRRRLERAASRMEAALESVVTQPPTPEILALGARLAPDSSAIAAALDRDGPLDARDVDRLSARAAAAAEEVLAAVPSPRTFAVRPGEVYRLASWVMEPWILESNDEAEGCDCKPTAWLETGWPAHAALACVDVGTIAGCAAVDRSPHCKALAALNAERASIPLGQGDPAAAEQLSDLLRRARDRMFAALRASIAALPDAEAQPERRAAALRGWCLSAFPGLRQVHDDAVRDIRAAGPQDADARIAAMDRAVTGAMERILAMSPGSATQDPAAGLRAVLGSQAALRSVANAFEQAAASLAPPPADDGVGAIGARLRDELP